MQAPSTTAAGLTIGATFAGYGGLDRAVEELFNAKVIWLSEYDKGPKTILAHNYPDAPNHDDITKIDWDTVAAPTIMTGGYPCFPTGTLILTKDEGWKAIEDVAAGDLVMTHRNRWRPVVRNWGSKQGVTVTITGQGHDGLVATDNHKFPAREKVRTYDGAPRSGRYVLTDEAVKVEAKDLAGKFWSTPTEFPASVVPPVPGLVGVDTDSPAFLWVVGKYLADGDLGALKNDRYYMVRFADGRDGGADETKQRLAEAGFAFSMNHDATADRAQVNSVHFATWLDENFGHGAATKTVATWAFGLTSEQRRALFDGYIQGDGHAIANGGVRFNSISKKLALGMRLLAGTLGYYTSISKVTPATTKEIEGRTVNQKPWWRVSCNTSSRTVVVDGGQHWGKVKTVEYTGRTETVWNLEVEEDNTYVVEGIVASNCQPFSHAGSRLGTDDKRHLFPFFAQGIDTLRPKMVLAENVRGHLSLGFDVVLAEWVRVGYDVQWMLIKASDVGAPHGRSRLFIFATDPLQMPALPEKGTALTELVDGVWSSPEEHLFGRDAFTGKWPKAGRLVGSVVYDNSDILGDPISAIREHLGSPANRLVFDDDLSVIGAVARHVEDVTDVEELLPTSAAALGAGGQKTPSGARKDELLLSGVAEALTSGDLLPTPRATRGGSGTETMYRLGAERTDDERPQGQVLLPTPVASLSKGAPTVEASRERALRPRKGLKLDEIIGIVEDDAHDQRTSEGPLLPTPVASLANGTTPTAARSRQRASERGLKLDETVNVLADDHRRAVAATGGAGRDVVTVTVDDDVPLLRTPQATVVEAKSGIKLSGRTPADPQVGLADQVMALAEGSIPLLKTPTAQLAINGGSQHPDKRKAGGHGPTLADEVEHLLPQQETGEDGPLADVIVLPTPTAADSRMGRNATANRREDAGPHNSGYTLTDLFVPQEHAPALLPTPRATDGEKGGPNQRGSSGDFMLPSAVHHMTDGANALKVDVLDEPDRLFPTPVVNDMGRAYTPDTWDQWTAKLKAAHGNGNGHGPSLEIEAARLAPLQVVPDQDDVELLPTPMTAYTSSTAEEWRARRPAGNGGVRERVGDLRIVTEELLPEEVKVLPTPTASERDRSPEEAARRHEPGRAAGRNGGGSPDLSSVATVLAHAEPEEPVAAPVDPNALPGYEQWGPYGPAIVRWEQVTGRKAPAATVAVKSSGAQRLSPVFVEWMMGQPEGWITDPAIWDGWKDGAARNAQLKACGNGVVTLQAATAVRLLILTR